MSRGYVLDRLFLTRYFYENFFETGIANAVRVDFKLRFVHFEKVQNFGDNVLFWLRKIDFEDIFLKALNLIWPLPLRRIDKVSGKRYC